MAGTLSAPISTLGFRIFDLYLAIQSIPISQENLDVLPGDLLPGDVLPGDVLGFVPVPSLGCHNPRLSYIAGAEGETAARSDKMG